MQALPYINGGLFEATIRTPDFTSEMRRAVLTAALLDWGKVSPAIFGSMFQGVMDPATRRNLGAHYTSEKNILRVIKPLFLDDLYAEFAKVRERRRDLQRFHQKLSTLHFLDPACGSGNFLAITYRELRRLEHKVVQVLAKGQMSMFDVRDLLTVNVDQLHGIEIEEFPALIAQTALWLTDHQMNLEASRELGQHYVRLPLTASANIRHANALTTDWADVVPPEKLSYILGNPPFNGSRTMDKEQKADLRAVAKGIREAGFLDFVTGWYLVASRYIESNKAIRIAFVSTNSVSQGEQVGILWGPLIKQGVRIHFAHRTFKWSNDARGVAAVYCVTIGFGLQSVSNKRIFDYPDIKGDPVEIAAAHINPYLVDGPDVFVSTRQSPLCDAPSIKFGNMPADGGHLILSAVERNELIEQEPAAEKYVLEYLGAQELINGNPRWCLWLTKADPRELRSMPKVLTRVNAVRVTRLKSSRPHLANAPTRFAQVTHDPLDFPSALAIPGVSSERRDYIPMRFISGHTVPSNLLHVIASATLYHFGVLTSRMHMAWVRTVCGRLKSDYRYSKDIVYNNFPWPEDVTHAQREAIERHAQAVLDARAGFPDATLADLYDPLTMPPSLVKAHSALDRAVDRLYRPEPFESDSDRVALLFERYQALTQ